MSKYVYFFGGGKAEGKADMKNLLGGKGANLAEMINLGIPVPPGFTISTEACIHYYKDGGKYPDGLMEEIEENIKKLEALVNKKFGDEKNPLLVSVRSGAAVSMPGMMDTILNLGLNDKTAKGLIASTKNERFVYDAYRRFLQMFGDVVLGIEHSKFEKILQMSKDKLSIKDDTGLDAKTLKEIVSEYKELIKNELGKDFPDNPKEHLKMAYDAVFNSWNNKRAITYRNIHNIPHTLGTAVNIQAMVFGNMGSTSGTGVCFTRDPSTGEKRFYGEYLINAQGEDVVAGIRTPLPIEHLKKDNHKIYDELVEIYQKMEKHYRDMQDLEFTIENGKLYLLQTRSGKRTAQSAVKIAVDMVGEGLIDRNTALLRIEPESLEQLLHPTINPKAAVKVIAKGLPASPGAAVGKVIFSSHKAIELGEGGEKIILVRKETSPEDIGGMAEAQGILTSTGGMTSHAAVVGRGMGKCCVVGCTAITVREDEGYFEADTMRVKEGDIITLNGSTGEVILGETELIEPQFSDSFKTLMEWADNTRKLGVRANADTPYDAKVARDFGAEGIGLCRTEHMFFGKDRLPIVRQMILAKDKGERVAALQKLLPMQKGDFKGIFKVMEKLPVTIRLLDPPLHEFLPTREEEMESVASEMKISVKELKDKVASLHEFNPMLGHRGCRLGITYPEVYDMQVQAIFEAACELVREGQKIIPEVMIPLVGHINEFKITKAQAIKTAEEVMARFGVQLNYLIGTMIELPRAALTADEIAKEADFFSFGTNDLTQMTFGFSRDDAGKFLPSYKEKGILERDPFVTIDQAGVGQLIKIGVQKGRSANPKLKVGICGEHGGEPLSVEFCHRAGLNYVSCSPYRVPIARFSAAQAVLKEK
ncbi:MAG: pyruvate, phosphate dikinase [Candidatus Omnitrophica bacterium]|nr:pyruvate, phosphate dikinase [Candidatus Omnitrophota bacterium]